MIERLKHALGDRYRVDALVGRGGMATVYRAVDLRHDRAVAIKVMNPDFAETVGRERFLREIRVTAGLSHPHILALHDSGDADGLLFYVMPFVEGVSLRERLGAEPRLSLDEVRKIVREVGSALSYAHNRGIVHRDIKPENILLAGYSASDAKAWNTLVADFGIAAPTARHAEHLTGTGIAVGSPQYMSPEQAVGDRVDHRSDIWALGCVVYEMLEGSPPRGVASFKRGVSPAITRAVLRALATDPGDRFGDVREFVDAIEAHTKTTAASWVRPLLWTSAAAVVAAVAVWSTMRHRPVACVPKRTNDTLALALVNRGRANVLTRNGPNVAEAVSQFSGAVARDSDFALAWSGLARAAQMAAQRGLAIPGRSPDSLIALALVASQRAVALDSCPAEVWLVRARVMESVDPTSRTAILSDLRRALAADSTDGEVWFNLGRAREEVLDSAGARAAFARAVQLDPKRLDLLVWLALHSLWSGHPADGIKWADSALAIDPTYEFARGAALQLAIELGDSTLAERHLLAYRRVALGPDRPFPLAHEARLRALRGEPAAARKLAAAAGRLADSTTNNLHQSVFLGEAFSAAGDTARAYRWLAAFSPRGDVHFQLHLQREPALAWLHGPRYRGLLSP
jgi:tRNA A-37 threonylcarbamoyl transferase component Bud32/tetratricopeptide (TPR) repeat protein